MREATSKQVEGERNKMASCTSNTNGKKKKKNMFVSHIKHMQQKINRSTSFTINNIYYINFRIQE